MSRHYQSGHGILIVGIVVVAVIILGLLGWVFGQNFINKGSTTNVTNFEQCKAAEGSKTLLTFPAQCITSDGRTFTGPVTQTNTVTTKTYCTEAEKLCFEYPESWKVSDVPLQNAEVGSKVDSLAVISPKDELVLTLTSGIGGIGGTCPDESKVSVKILSSIPIEDMTGYKTEYSQDTLQVARVVYPDGLQKYVTALYVTGDPEYTKAGTISACNTGFSMFINGKNSRISGDFEGAGAFRFEYNGQNGVRFGSEKDAIDAFDSDVYKQGVSILASLHYE